MTLIIARLCVCLLNRPLIQTNRRNLREAIDFLIELRTKLRLSSCARSRSSSSNLEIVIDLTMSVKKRSH